MDRSTTERAVLWAEWALLFCAVLYAGLHVVPRAWTKLNTDFANYYVPARLVHDGFHVARLNEWVWLERQKDHLGVDAKLISFVPITPFSTLALWPVSGLAPLAAKHAWVVLNLMLLVPLAFMLQRMTELGHRRIALLIALSFPLYRNLLFGQFYLVLLFLLVAACWAYLRGSYSVSAALITIAAACKVFPLVFLVFFLQRRKWRALLVAAGTATAVAAISVAVFGWDVHRTYLREVLPWTLRGEGMPPYVVSSASISSVLHYLFLAEPEWDPHPWRNSPLAFSLLQPTLQALVLAPAILLVRRTDEGRSRALLEWSALLTALLAVSTMPASYHFVLLVLPVCVLASVLIARKRYGWLALLLLVYLGIGFPMPSPHGVTGLAVLLYVPRLPLMLVLVAGHYWLLRPAAWSERPAWDWTHSAWATAVVLFTVFSVRSTLHVQRAMRGEYAYRLPLATQAFLAADPVQDRAVLRYVALTRSGYHLQSSSAAQFSTEASGVDELSFANRLGNVWVERASAGRSDIVERQDQTKRVVDDARSPMLSSDGRSLAFIHDDHGRGQLRVQEDLLSPEGPEAGLSPASMDVYEASFLSREDYVFSAVERRGPPQLYVTDATHHNAPLALGEARYPALSPDGRWMAYSRMGRGMWNLWVLDRQSGAVWRVADVPCNQIQASWEEDSQTLLYASDCGRSLWFTAIARRRVVPPPGSNGRP